MEEGYTLLISDEANADILDAFLWYESARDGLGSDFILCLEAEINRIARNPRQYQIQYKKIRVAYIERFPYGVHFHTSLDPGNWEERLT